MFDLERDLAELYQMDSEVSNDLEVLEKDHKNGIIDLVSYAEERSFLEDKLQEIQEDIQDLEKEIEGEQ